MLLVVAILSAIMSISLGIFNIIFDQVRISGEIADSFLSFYSADEGIEKTLYLDRITYINNAADDYPYGLCGKNPGISCYTTPAPPAGTLATVGGCYQVTMDKAPGSTVLKVIGQYPRLQGADPCGESYRIIKRGFNLTY